MADPRAVEQLWYGQATRVGVRAHAADRRRRSFTAASSARATCCTTSAGCRAHRAPISGRERRQPDRRRHGQDAGRRVDRARAVRREVRARRSFLRGYGEDEPLVHRTLNPSIPVIVDPDRVAAVAHGRGGRRRRRRARRRIPAPRASRATPTSCSSAPIAGRRAIRDCCPPVRGASRCTRFGARRSSS